MDIDAADAREAAMYGEIGYKIVTRAAVDVEARLGQNLSMIILRGTEVGGWAAPYMQHRATHKGREWQRGFTSHGGYRLKYSMHAAIPYEPEASFRDFLILVPDCGAKVHKVQGLERPALSERVVRLFKMVQTSIRNDDLEAAANSFVCNACKNFSRAKRGIWKLCLTPWPTITTNNWMARNSFLVLCECKL